MATDNFEWDLEHLGGPSAYPGKSPAPPGVLDSRPEDAAVALIARAFPGTTNWGAPAEKVTEATRRASLSWFVDQLWGQASGIACLDWGDNGYFGPTGRYEFPKGDFHGSFYQWPQQRDALIGRALALSDASDVYVCPMLRTSRRRSEHNGAGGRHLWADLDQDETEWTPEMSEALAKMLRKGSFVINSGRGRHVYLALEAWQPPERIAELNRRLALTLGGDAKWQTNSLLRPPGTYSHKERARGRTSLLVGWGQP